MVRVGRRARQYSQAARVLHLIDFLGSRRHGATLADLAERFAVTERQVRRDVSAIQEAGHDCQLATVRGRAGARLVEGRAGTLRLSVRERYALLAVRRVFDALAGTSFADDVKSIFEKVVASLPDDHRSEIEAYGERFVYVPDGGTKEYRRKEDVLDAILTGVIRRWRVRCRYRSARGNLRGGILEPYAMALYRHGLYVVGLRDDGSGVRTYAVERFTGAEFLRGSSFEVPADFDIDRFFDGAFGLFTGGEAEHVVAVFEPEIAHLVRARRWHPTQKVRSLPRGRVRLELEVTNVTQVVQWLVGWGPWVRVVAPESLRDRVRAEHVAAAGELADR